MKPIHILLVEDNEGDIFLITEGFEEGKIVNRVSVVKDGEAAINFLEQRGAYEKEELPDLILMDVNMPKINGHEALEYIKETNKLKHIPVIMLSTSSAENDILLAYKNYANCFITKPVDAESLMKIILSIENFWINIVTLTSNNDNERGQKSI